MNDRRCCTTITIYINKVLPKKLENIEELQLKMTEFLAHLAIIADAYPIDKNTFKIKISDNSIDRCCEHEK